MIQKNAHVTADDAEQSITHTFARVYIVATAYLYTVRSLDPVLDPAPRAVLSAYLAIYSQHSLVALSQTCAACCILSYMTYSFFDQLSHSVWPGAPLSSYRRHRTSITRVIR